MIRAVFDTNVLASGLVLTPGAPGRLMELWVDNAFELIVSEPILVELERTLSKPYFQGRMDSAAAEHAIDGLRLQSIVTPLTVHIVGIATHAADDVVLAAAHSARADVLVTGDAGLLSVHNHRGVRILNPRDFLTLLEDDRERSTTT